MKFVSIEEVNLKLIEFLAHCSEFLHFLKLRKYFQLNVAYNVVRSCMKFHILSVTFILSKLIYSGLNIPPLEMYNIHTYLFWSLLRLPRINSWFLCAFFKVFFLNDEKLNRRRRVTWNSVHKSLLNTSLLQSVNIFLWIRNLFFGPYCPKVSSVTNLVRVLKKVHSTAIPYFINEILKDLHNKLLLHPFS